MAPLVDGAPVDGEDAVSGAPAGEWGGVLKPGPAVDRGLRAGAARTGPTAAGSTTTAGPTTPRGEAGMTDASAASSAAMYAAISAVRLTLHDGEGSHRPAGLDELVADLVEQHGPAAGRDLVAQLAYMAAEVFRAYPDPLAELDAHEQAVLQLETKARDDLAE